MMRDRPRSLVKGVHTPLEGRLRQKERLAQAPNEQSWGKTASQSHTQINIVKLPTVQTSPGPWPHVPTYLCKCDSTLSALSTR